MQYTLCNVMKQFWTAKKYEYTKKPRKNSGLLYLLKGEMEYITDKGKINLKSGDVILLPENSYYEVLFCGYVESYLVNFKTSIESIRTPVFVCNDNTGIIHSAFKKLHESYIEGGETFLTASLFYLLLHNITLFKNRNKEDIKLETAKKLLTDEADYSVGDVANKLFMSRSGLEKIFKEKTGQSPIKFKLSKKIEKAKLMLHTTDIPIKDIADSLNFYDISYFYKTFKQYVGETPQKYRKKSQATDH